MKNKIIVALDVDSLGKAKNLINKLAPYVNIFKVGSELFTTCGPEIIEYLKKKRKKVFLDLKFYDIPNTVEKATLAAIKHNVFMLTLHTSGGGDMLKKASHAAKGKKTILAGVTILTSKKSKTAKKDVIKLARLAKESGLGAIVCSPKETEDIKKIFKNKLLIINPGVRPSWAAKDDQKRITTPRMAFQNGADFIVIGRPITKAKDPKGAARKILEEVK